jgi:alpha-mannosidase
MALITDGLHEYEVLPTTNELALTLLRAVGWLSRDDLKTRTGHAGPALETPGAQVLGQHEFHYSLYFHAGDWNAGTVWRAAEAALLPLQPGRDQRSAAVKPVIELEPDCVQITACIPTEDGYHLRILNASDDSTDGTVRLEPAPRSASLTTVGRTSSERLRINQGLRLRLRPWQIATLAIVR